MTPDVAIFGLARPAAMRDIADVQQPDAGRVVTIGGASL